MSVPAGARHRAQGFFDDLWERGDPWELETSPFEVARYRRQLELLSGRRYEHVLEIGCGAGAFTRHLAGVADAVLAVDVSAVAIDRARARVALPGVDFRVADAIKVDRLIDSPLDLVVISETIYFLGWLNSFFDIAWFAATLLEATRPGGRVLLANTIDGGEHLCRPWVIRTYRDLFLNVGYELEAEEVFRGMKDETPLEVLMSLFRRPADSQGSV
jgi:SAM-dependent methyltransferase